MNDGPVSDELLNALVDGELGPDETDALLARAATDGPLRDRLAQLRWTRDAVRHAYRPPAPAVPRGETQRPVRRTLVLATLFGGGLLGGWLARGVGAGQPPHRFRDAWSVSPSTAPAAASAAPQRVVLHLGSNGPGQPAATLERAEGLMLAARDAGHVVAVEIVANGSGLDLLRVAASEHGPRIASLQAAHPTLTLVACGQSVQRLRELGADVRLLPGTVVATSALDRIVARLQQGWAYVRI